MSDNISNNGHQIPPELITQLAMTQHQKTDDDIDLGELWRAIWAGKWIIIIITALFAVSSVFYALSLPNVYQSEALLVPAEVKSSSIGMSSQLGGLASLAGVNLGGGGTDKTGLALEIMKSRAFIFKFIEQHEITAKLMAVKKWNIDSNQLVYNEEIYSSKDNKWVGKDSFIPKPSLQMSYSAFQSVVSINQNTENSMVTIGIKHYSPYIAQQWVNWLIDAINKEMKDRDLIEAKNSISYLNQQLENTNVADTKTMLYQLIEEQTKTVMFANVREQYVLKTIDPALVPELKTGPKRALICISGVLLGGMLGMLLVFIRYFKNYKPKPKSS